MDGRGGRQCEAAKLVVIISVTTCWANGRSCRPELSCGAGDSYVLLIERGWLGGEHAGGALWVEALRARRTMRRSRYFRVVVLCTTRGVNCWIAALLNSPICSEESTARRSSSRTRKNWMRALMLKGRLQNQTV